MMRVLLETAVLAAFVHTASLAAQVRQNLVGTWRLIAASASDSAGIRDSTPYGSQPTGFLTYTLDGRMMAIISHGGRKPLSVADRQAAPVGERAEAFATFLAYAGGYTISGDTVIHHVEAASVQNWVGTDLVRVVKLKGDRIVLRTPPVSVGGSTRQFELSWKRLNERPE